MLGEERGGSSFESQTGSESVEGSQMPALLVQVGILLGSHTDKH